MKIVDGGDDSKSVSERERSLQNFAESALENQSRFAYSGSASRTMPPPLPLLSKELSMSRLLLPLEHPTPAAEQDAEEALLHGLKRLPRRVQQVFLLSRLDQLDFASIAARLDLPLLSIERHMNQALQTARAQGDAVASVAGQWYVRLQSPEATACERIDFRRWLDADPAHLQAFHDTELRWRSLLAPARALGQDGWYRQGRAAISLGGCSVAVGLGVAAVLLLGYWV